MARPEHTLYVPLALAGTALGMTAEEAAADTLLVQSLDTGCARIETSCGRVFWRDPEPTVRQQRVRILRNPGEDDLLLIDDVADADGLVVEFRLRRGGDWVPHTDFDVEPPERPGWPTTALRGCWPSRRLAVRTTGPHGWPAVPADITGAALLQTTRLYRRKDSPQGVIGSADWGVSRVSRADPDVEAMITDFILQ
ncbi:phage gp6-like head-tail connector protein [Plantactinospora sp. WMMB334]|uniref:phage gp6-like head-tail connector protein n=1 Tax=Plantactinospora sp. WMMB334 TaxID=3404119 RepID=UPI003B92449E